MSETLSNSLAATGRGLPPVRIMNRESGSAAAASSPGGGKATGEIVRTSNQWRDNYNPLRSLVISRVVTLLEAAERGDYADLQLTLRKIERRYPVLKALKSRRLSALEKLDWDIKVAEPLPNGATEAMAEAQRAFLRSRYELIENLTEAFGFLVTAEFRGYSILQKHRCNDGGANDGAVCELHWLPQDQFCRDGQFGDFYYNKDSRFGIGGDACQSALGEKNRIGSTELPKEEFIIRDCDAPLYEVALVSFVEWAMGRKDESAFVEIFGLPNAIVILPPGIPAGKEDEYRSAAEKVADGVSGALPNGGDVKFPTSSVRGNAPFKDYCETREKDVVLAGTGGLLTMLSMPTGIGQGASGEHGDAFDDIAQADARKINSILQGQFDKIELNAQFEGQPHLVYFELCAREEEDVTATIAQIASLKTAGFTVKREMVEEKTGFELEEAEAMPGSDVTADDEAAAGDEGADLPEDPNDAEAMIFNRLRILNRDDDEDGRWITTETGRHLFIRDGESADDSIKRSFDDEKSGKSDQKTAALKKKAQDLREANVGRAKQLEEIRTRTAAKEAELSKLQSADPNRDVKDKAASLEQKLKDTKADTKKLEQARAREDRKDDRAPRSQKILTDQKGEVVSGPKKMIGHTKADDGEFYHGTSASNVESILKNGIKPTDKTLGFKAAFVGQNANLAHAYGAGSAATAGHKEVAIVVVKNPGAGGGFSPKGARNIAYHPEGFKPDQIDRVEIYRANAGKDEKPLRIVRPGKINNREPLPAPQAALAEVIAPLLQRLEAINGVTDDTTRTALLQQFVASEIEPLRAALKANPTLAQALAPVLAKEMKL